MVTIQGMVCLSGPSSLEDTESYFPSSYYEPAENSA